MKFVFLLLLSAVLLCGCSINLQEASKIMDERAKSVDIPDSVECSADLIQQKDIKYDILYSQEFEDLNFTMDSMNLSILGIELINNISLNDKSVLKPKKGSILKVHVKISSTREEFTLDDTSFKVILNGETYKSMSSLNFILMQMSPIAYKVSNEQDGYLFFDVIPFKLQNSNKSGIVIPDESEVLNSLIFEASYDKELYLRRLC